MDAALRAAERTYQSEADVYANGLGENYAAYDEARDVYNALRARVGLSAVPHEDDDAGRFSAVVAYRCEECGHVTTHEDDYGDAAPFYDSCGPCGHATDHEPL